ncbi:MAG: hypothetical protein ACJ8CR_20370, partial [Roseiflexaceae bacterium]
LDGLSMALRYNDSRFQQAVTRGDGSVGEEVTPNVRTIRSVPLAIDKKAKLPDELGQLKGLYNSTLAGKRVLILADDAKDAGQVRPLLPPQGCALLVTSRTRFSLPGMAALDLGTLPSEEAKKLLSI